MRLFWVLLLLSVECYSTTTAYHPEPYHHLSVPFTVEEGTGSQSEEVFLQFWSRIVTSEEGLAIRVEIEASDEVHLRVDKCGRRLFETTKNFTEAEYYFNKDWINTSRTDIQRSCTHFNQHALNFTFFCDGSCNGTMNFSIANVAYVDFMGIQPNDFSMQGTILFKTPEGGGQHKVGSEISSIIESVFLNARVEFSLAIEYSTSYTLTIGKCDTKMIEIRGSGAWLNYSFGWEQVKQLRLAKTLECPGELEENIYYTITSEEGGYGSVTFLMTRILKAVPNHPQSTFGFMELAVGVPDPVDSLAPVTEKPAVPVNSAELAAIIPIFFIIGLLFVM